MTILNYVVRWKFTDLDTDETVTLPFNPNAMSTPTSARSVSHGWTSGNVIRSQDRGQATPTNWTFSGVIFLKTHYDLLLSWAQRGTVLRVDDHLGRSFEIIIESYAPTERRPTQAHAWRAEYQMSCLLLKEVTA